MSVSSPKKEAGKPDRPLRTAAATPIPVAAKSKQKLPPKPAQIQRDAITITIEDISLRAYFIPERRKSHGLPGDETADWVEAERQLLIETAKKQG